MKSHWNRPYSQGKYRVWSIFHSFLKIYKKKVKHSIQLEHYAYFLD